MNKQRQDSHDSDKGEPPLQQQQLQSKRPRTSTACVRCHLKKVRCDGRRPNCDRCAANEKMCAYPTRRRSRNTQPTDMDPFIDDLSQLETRIRAIESEQEALWDLIQRYETADDLVPRMVIIDQEVQTSRASLARQRLLREQHIARSKQQQQQASSSASSASSASSSSGTNSHSNKSHPRRKNGLVKDKQSQPQPQQVNISPHPPTCIVQSTWDEMFPALAWATPQQQSMQSPATQSTQHQHQLTQQEHQQQQHHQPGPPKEWFDHHHHQQQQQIQNAQQHLQQNHLYASSSTSTTSSGSPPFNPPTDVMMESYELMNLVINDDPLLLNPQDSAGASWLGHSCL